MDGEPREFGPYRLIRRLGVGGMAETFEAVRTGTSGFEQRVCIKRVLPAFSEDDDFVSRFRREARLAAQLRHTNVVGVVDFGEINGVQYMALELVDGVDLRSFLKSAPDEKLPAETVALIGFDLARALEHAHATLVHRDISPSNILLSRTGEAKLADFGLAKAIESTAVTVSRSARGKIPYMSPEHIRGEPVDVRADLFSLGVVMFEAVAGVRPFDGTHDVETMQRILDGNPRSLAEMAPHVPSALRDAIERLIEVDPHARTATASQLIEALGAVVPTPATRRELADVVESHRGGPVARLHVRARDDERDTELSRPPPIVATPGRKQLASGAPGRRNVGGRWVRAGALAAGLIAVILGARWVATGVPEPARKVDAAHQARGAATGSEAGAASVPVAAAVAASEPAAAPVDSPASGLDPQSATPATVTEPAAAVVPAARARLGKGWLHVIVQPWGNVWIDGVWMGRAPVKARLSEGRHVIKAGRELPSATRIVRLASGARKEVEISLSE